MRLIDADNLIPIMKYTTTDNEIGVFPIRIGFNTIKRVIDEAPTIDAVQVVRCKECKHWSGNEKMHNNHLCKRAQDQNIDYWTRGDDFCSYGERKGGGDE